MRNVNILAVHLILYSFDIVYRNMTYRNEGIKESQVITTQRTLLISKFFCLCYLRFPILKFLYHGWAFYIFIIFGTL